MKVEKTCVEHNSQPTHRALWQDRFATKTIFGCGMHAGSIVDTSRRAVHGPRAMVVQAKPAKQISIGVQVVVRAPSGGAFRCK